MKLSRQYATLVLITAFGLVIGSWSRQGSADLLRDVDPHSGPHSDRHLFGADIVPPPPPASRSFPRNIEELDELVAFYGFAENSKIIGRPEHTQMAAARLQALQTHLLNMRTPSPFFLSYVTDRMRDKQFASDFAQILERIPMMAPRLATLAETAATYRMLDRDVEAIRVHTAFSAAEKADMIQRADLSGWRGHLQVLLVDLLAEIGYLDPEINPRWRPLFDFFRADLAAVVEATSKSAQIHIEVLNAMRTAVWGTAHPTAEVARAYESASKRREVVERHAAALFLWIFDSRESQAFENYLSDRNSFDEAVIAMFSLPEVRADRALAQKLSRLFNIRGSVRNWKILRADGWRSLAAAVLVDEAQALLKDFSGHPEVDHYRLIFTIAFRARHLDSENQQAIALVDESNAKIVHSQSHLAGEYFARHGVAQGIAGRYDEARAFLREGLRLSSDNDALSQWFVVVSYTRGGREAALSAWRERYPGRSGTWEREVKDLVYRGLWDFATWAEMKQMRYAAMEHYSRLYGLIGDDYLFGNKARETIIGKLAEIYRGLPLKPALPLEAIRFAKAAENHLESGDGIAALDAYRSALLVAPWWPEGYYNQALIFGVLGGYPGAVRAMERYLRFIPDEGHVSNARRKLGAWQRIMRVQVARGAAITDAPFLLPPIGHDREPVSK